MTDVEIASQKTEYSQSLGSAVSWRDLDLNREASSISSVTNVDNVLSGFIWQDDDEDTSSWLPQGITGLKDTSLGKKTIVVSWYHETKGVRLSFVDLETRTYRHVLLIISGNDVIAPLLAHAGGIATIGHVIYVAHTSFGIRQFDTRLIYPAVASSNSDFGIKSNGDIEAYNYRYVLPQQYSYDASSYIGNNPSSISKFSFLSRIWADSDNDVIGLLSGNFNRDNSDYENSPSRICRWLMDTTANTLRLNGDVIVLNCENVQGAVLRTVNDEDVLYLSRSYSSTEYKLYVVQVPSDYSNPSVLGGFTKYDWCARSEDLFLSSTDNLWCLTETKQSDPSSIARRVVFRVDPDSYSV